MSTYYYLVCDDHKERCNLATSNKGFLFDALETLPQFSEIHAGCNVQIHHENAPGDWEDTYMRWTKENVDKLYSMHLESGRWPYSNKKPEWCHVIIDADGNPHISPPAPAPLNESKSSPLSDLKESK